MKKFINNPLLFSMFLFLYLFPCLAFSQQDQQLILKVIVKNEKTRDLEFEKIKDGIIRTLVVTQSGEPVKGLDKPDFALYKKNKKAIINSVIPLTEVQDTRMRVLLLIDNSFSMNKVTDQVIKILDDLMANLGQGVKICAAIFDRNFQNPRYSFKDKNLTIRMSEYTTDKKEIRQLYNEGYRSLCEKTFLYDEIYAGIKGFKNDTTKKIDRNFAIILSDGADIGSFTGQNNITEILPSNLVFYNIDFMHAGSGEGKPNKFLKELAQKTGGEYYNPKDIKSLSDFFRQIATKIVDKGYQISYSFPEYKPIITNDLEKQIAKRKTDLFTDFSGLVVEEIIVKESFPLLNYIFFDKESDTLPERYILLKNPEESRGFSEKTIKGDALTYYYNILNIIGKRFKSDTSKILTISGFTDGKEKGGKALAQSRIEVIKAYFEKVWEISAERINAIAKIIPDKPSAKTLEEGLAENRRIEIHCDSWDVLKPVTFEEKEYHYQPKGIRFRIRNAYPEIEDAAQISEWEMDFFRNGQKWKSLKGENTNSDRITYDWRSEDGRLPLDSFAYSYSAKIVDNGGDVSVTPVYKIPVRQVKQEIIKTDSTKGKQIEKISLVLFEFNKFDLGKRNDMIMSEYVFPRLKDSLYIIVNGYTDIIGQEAANLKLSINRAKSVSDKIAERHISDRLFYEGYGATKPLYNNQLPEGRFYNRTVQMLLQDFPPEQYED